MTLVEGFGDEVTQFFVGLVVVGLALLAWWSTNISDTPLVRTVLVLERRRVEAAPTRSEHQQPVRPPDIASSPAEAPISREVVPEQVEAADGIASSPIASDEPKEDGEVNNATSAEESSLSSDSSPQSEIRRRRIASMETRTSSNPENPEHTEEASNEQEITSGSIRIRLKYLNDEQKLVQGRLTEPLGDFKRRHFDLELSANKLVRLIFNGQVLARDGASLEEHGLFDNCVIHCLVHQPRSSNSNNSSSTEGNTARREDARETEGNNSQRTERREFDLGTLLFVLLSILLGLAWYGRCVYSQYFTNTASVALIGLTGLLAVSFVGYMMPEQEIIR